jgi:hypothetical protein
MHVLFLQPDDLFSNLLIELNFLFFDETRLKVLNLLVQLSDLVLIVSLCLVLLKLEFDLHYFILLAGFLLHVVIQSALL